MNDERHGRRRASRRGLTQAAGGDARHRDDALARLLSNTPIFAAMQDAVLVAGTDAAVVFANAAAARIFEVPVGELIAPLSQYATRFWLRESPGVPTVPLAQLALRGEVVPAVERLIRTPGGVEKVLRASAAPLRDDRGAIVGAVVLAADISAQKAAEERAREHAARLEQANEERARALAEAERAAELLEHGDALLELDRSWVVVRVNAAHERATGRRRSETVGRVLPDLWPEVVQTRAWREYRRCMDERVPVRFEDYVESLDTWVDVSAYPTSTGGVAIFFRDVTARKRAGRDQSRLASIVENTQDAIISKALDGTIETWNRGAERLFGYTAAEVVGRPISILLPGDRLDEEDLIQARIRAGHRVDPYETVRLRRGGSPVEVSVTVSPLRDEAGAIVGASKIARDVTEQRRRDRALRDSEAKFRSVFEQAAIGMGRARCSDGRWIDVNDALCGMLGRTEEELLATPWPEITHPEDLDLDLVPFRRMAAGELESYTVEKRFIHADGHHVWAKLAVSLVRDAAGKPDYAIAIIEDIGDRKRAEEALRESEARHRAFFLSVMELAGVHEAVRDASGAVVDSIVRDANEPVLRFLGRRRDEVVGMRLSEVFPPGVASALTAPWTDLLATAVPVRYEVGFAGHVLAVSASRMGADTVAAVADDVTERKRAEDALRRSEERLRLAQQVARIGTFEFFPDTRTGVWSPEMEALYGLPPGGYGGSYEEWAALVLPDDRPAVERRLREALDTGVFETEWRIVRPDGTVRWVAARGQVFKDDHGKPVRMVGVNVDIAERKQMEEALRDADRRKDEFLGMLSHELRNPLAPIRNALYILDRAQPGGQQAQRAKDIANRQVAHLTRLVDDLLDVTRIARGKIELRHEQLDLAALARRTAEDYRPLMQDRGLELRVEIPAQAVTVTGDPARLTQVLGNLLNNAAKFTPPGGRVSLSMGTDDRGRAVVHVRDTGPGISPDVLPTLFEPFTQGKQTLARSEGGLGLGLSLVKGLVALHGGEVAAASAPGGGADFVVRVPLAADAAGEEPATDDAAGAVPRRRRRILVIDDNHDAAETVAELARMLGHEVDVAFDAHDGLAKVARRVPDVIFCDIGLPGMDGYAFAQRLRASTPGQHVRLVALSGYAQPEDVARALEAGFDAHIAKPAAPEELERLLA